jgi:hypothetical protein
MHLIRDHLVCKLTNCRRDSPEQVPPLLFTPSAFLCAEIGEEMQNDERRMQNEEGI